MKCNRRFFFFCCIFLFLGGLFGSFVSLHKKELSTKTLPESTLLSDELFLLLEDTLTTSQIEQLLLQAPYPVEILDSFDSCLLLHAAPEFCDKLLSYFQENAWVRTAEYNQELNLSGITVDEYSDTQWALSNSGTYLQVLSNFQKKGTYIPSTCGIDLNIEQAWEYYNTTLTPKREPIVAIIDTGIDINHPELYNHIWINEGEIPGDGIDNDGNGYIDDVNGWDFYNNDSSVCHYGADQITTSFIDNDNHGTHLAGIIAAQANNEIGIAGIASNVNVKIMPLKIHGGSNGKGTIANAIKAIKYATIMGADICNMSWGTTIYSASLEEVMKESTMLFITAAGNEGNLNDTIPIYPASFDLKNMISVTFIDADGQLPPDANRGAESIDIAAPGKDIFSTTVGSYQTMSGSSMAAPHISAVAAMVYSLGKWYAPEVKELLLSNLLLLTSLENNVRYPGIPNTLSLLDQTKNLTIDTIAPTLSIHDSFDQNLLSLSFIASDKGGSGVRVIRYAAGTKNVSDFRKGMAGTPIRSDILKLSKAGYYTFYISDYAGNESTILYYIEDDTTPPSLSANYSKTKQEYTISVEASDSQSGVKTLKYAQGIFDVSDFKSGKLGTDLNLIHNKASFSVSATGSYTIYATDFRGNKTVTYINIPEEIQVKNISLNYSTRILLSGKKIQLNTKFYPKESIDTITYRSSQVAVATVNSYGVVTAVSPGITIITATTSHGLSAKCIVLVV